MTPNRLADRRLDPGFGTDTATPGSAPGASWVKTWCGIGRQLSSIGVWSPEQ